MILPPATLGMLGGGQLGRFFVAAAHEMGYKVWVLDPDPHSPAGLIADRHLRAGYDDFEALDALADSCAAVTTEFENVPATTLDYLAKFIPVRPGASAVAVCQNRIAEKSFLRDNGIPHGPFAVIHSDADIAAADGGLYPAILKVARFGYDGKGQARVANVAEAVHAFHAFKGEACVLEALLTLDCEVSVVLVRGEDGLFRSPDGTDLPADTTAKLQDRSLEGSNVNPIENMVAMISAARQFETQMKLLQTAEADEKAATQLLSNSGG